MDCLVDEVLSRVLRLAAGVPAGTCCRRVCQRWRALLDAPGVWGELSPAARAELVGRLCSEGAAAALVWAARAFGLTASNARAYDNLALRLACLGGHLPTAQRLVAIFGLTAGDARAVDSCALHWACAHGHLEVARWLVATFGLTAKDAQGCTSEHAPVASWLAATFGERRGSSRLSA
jgi:hypothetical protein